MRRATIRPARRAIHLVGDLILLGWALAWLAVAGIVRSTVGALAVPAAALGRSTSSLANTMDNTATTLSEVQFVGEQLAAPFRPIGGSLRDIASQATQQVAAVEQASWVLALVVWLVPTLTLAIIYLPPRIRRARESAAARAYINDHADLDLFALRAMAKAPMTRIARISDDPVAAWRAADASIIQQLANLELRRVGIGVVELNDMPTTGPSR